MRTTTANSCNSRERERERERESYTLVDSVSKANVVCSVNKYFKIKKSYI